MPACDYVDAKDMVERAREHEKDADALEAIENLEETATQMSLDEFKDAFGLVEVLDKPENSTGCRVRRHSRPRSQRAPARWGAHPGQSPGHSPA